MALKKKAYVGTHNGVKKGKESLRRAACPLHDKAAAKLALRKKFDAEHGTHKGKHLHTVPGSMKIGGGF